MSSSKDQAKNVVDAAEKAKQAELKAKRKAEFEAKFKKQKEEEALKSQGKTGEKSKADLKAERRALQEAQRAAKTAENDKNNKKPAANAAKVQPDSTTKNIPQKDDNNNKKQQQAASGTTVSPPKEGEQKANNNKYDYSLPVMSHIFSHLPKRTSDLSSIDIAGIPPCMVEAGYRINQDLFKGSTAKCIAILQAFKSIALQYQPVSNTDDLKHELQTLMFEDCVKFLAQCRPISIAMENTIKHLKLEFSKYPADLNDAKLRDSIVNSIDRFISEDMINAWESIIERISSKINTDDTIMTLGYSTLLRNALISAWKRGRKFHVIVVETRPKSEGVHMLDTLVAAGIPATYCLITGISYIMPNVTRVLIEADALMGNGNVMSQSGASVIALVAKAFNVQFIVCCETFKFSERVHTDCFVHNELGDEKEFFKSIPVSKRPPMDDLPNLHVMDMLYDLTPHEFVTAIVTEKSLMPSTSVPIILRIRESK